MFCRKCGKTLPDGADFCPSCGTKVVTLYPIKGKSNIEAIPKKYESNTIPANQTYTHNVTTNEETKTDNNTQETKKEFGLVGYLICCEISIIISATIAGTLIISLLLFTCGGVGFTITKSLWKTNKIKAVAVFLIDLISVSLMFAIIGIKNSHR